MLISVKAPNGMFFIEVCGELLARPCHHFQVELLEGDHNTWVMLHLGVTYNDSFVQAHRLRDLHPGVLPDCDNTGPFIRVLRQDGPD